MKSYSDNNEKASILSEDEENDCYICPNGKRLDYIYTKKYTTDNKYETNRKVYQCEDCSDCPYRERCYHSEKNRTIRVSHKLNEQNRKAEELITT